MEPPASSSASDAAPGPKVYTSLKKQAKPTPSTTTAITTADKSDKDVQMSISTTDGKEETKTKSRKRKPKVKVKEQTVEQTTESRSPVSSVSPVLNADAAEFNPDEMIQKKVEKKPKKAVSEKPKKEVPASTTIVKKIVPVAERRPVERPKPVKALTAAQILRLEIDQLKIRFPDLTESLLGDRTVLEMRVPILDPEFPFDLESVHLQIEVPKEYPTGASPSYALLNNDVPENLKGRFKMHMDRAAKSLLGQQALRPMIRFLENNLEMMLTPPANPTGFKFVAPVTKPEAPASPRIIEPPADVIMTYQKSQEQASSAFEMPPEYYAAMRELNLSDEMDEDNSQEMGEQVKGTRAFEQTSLPLKKVPESRFKPSEHVKIEPISKGAIAGAIQLQLHNLKLRGIGLMVITKLGISMKCDRCKVSTPIDDLRPDVDRIYACKKCTVKSTVHFKLDAVHEHSRSGGFIRCRGGMPSELLPSTLQVTCSQCAPDDPNAATVRIENVQIGETVSFGCRYCHSECSIEMGRADWIHIPGLMEGAKPKRGAIPKLPSQVGEPLPDKGTCKHYKKSFRWFRFPCCGKAYPCDTCHDEDPSNAGHKADWATRMICGACSREMSISQKDCPCGAQPASTRHSSHWEGGKGTRDQNKMSKKDSKKYRNLTKPIKPASK